MFASRALRAASRSRAAPLRLAPQLAVPASRTFMSSCNEYGAHLFKGAVADKYLAKQGLPAGLLNDPEWTRTSSDGVNARA